MSGKACTEANEFMKIYKLAVVQVPTNIRWCTSKDQGLQDQGRQVGGRAGDQGVLRAGAAVLVGAISVEVSEVTSGR